MIEPEWMNEENYLQNVYAELMQTKEELEASLSKVKDEGFSVLAHMSDDVKLNFDSTSENLDTYANMEMKNREIDQLNMKVKAADIQLQKVNRLLQSPYFGKISVDFLEDEPIEDFYIGFSHFTGSTKENLVYDWRSPVAELFYNNTLGDSSYTVNQYQIEVDIKNRRQFIIEKDRLIRFFDTSIAIQDDVLLEALEQDSTHHMQDITSTIQAEQNVIIRDTKNRHILVNGIAGSGKTSTIMQRIAYLLYSLRHEITSENVLILSPNNHFIEYISTVLPSLGEKNPLNVTLLQFIQQHSPLQLEDEETYFDRISAAAVSQQTTVLRSKEFVDYIKQADHLFSTSDTFFTDLTLNGTTIISREDISAIYETTPENARLIDRIQGTKNRLISYLDEHIIHQSHDPNVQDQIYTLPEDLQQQYFGELITDESKESVLRYTTKWLRKEYGTLAKDIRSNQWLNVRYLFEKLFAHYTGNDYQYDDNNSFSLDEAVIFMYVQHTFVEKYVLPNMRFILVDEIQDYTPAQISLLSDLFPKSDFTMVGDENQAIFNSSIGFDDIAADFETRGKPIKRYDLLNSYRSSGAITELFRQLAVPGKQMEIIPVRPRGNEPQLFDIADNQELVQLLDHTIEQLNGETLTVITKSVKEAKSILETLKESEALSSKVEVLPISHSKGLEFDNVLIFNASAANYSTEREKKILYTAISRAMKNLFITYQTEPTSFISQ